MPVRMQNLAALTAFTVAALVATAASAQKKYDPGASDTEIKIGNIMPYSGPASAYGVIGKAQAAYFKKINEEGGINGRKINFISYDDAFSPPKAVEQARKLVESDEVLLIFQPLGTQSNSATQKYMNSKKVPQLFVATGATKFGDPQNFPWTMGWQPNYQSEGRIYAAYILKNFPNGKIAALWQNDDAGKDQMKGLRDGLGAKAGMIIADKSYEVSDPTIDSQIVALKDFGRRHLHDVGSPEGSGAGDPQGCGTRLEAGVSARQRLDIGRNGAQAGRPRKCQGHHLDRLSEGSRPIPCGRTIRASRPGSPSWTSISLMATRPITTTSTAMPRRRPWFRF